MCRNLGKIVLAIGIVNFYIGVDIYYDGDQTTKGVHIYIAAAVILGFFLLLAVLKDAYDHITNPQPALADVAGKDGVAYAMPNGTQNGSMKPHSDEDLMSSRAGLTQAA